MKKAKILIHNKPAGTFIQFDNGSYIFQYDDGYNGVPIALTLPFKKTPYLFNKFPSFFDGLLPEGHQLEGLLKQHKIDRNDYFSQLILVGSDLVGAVTIEKINE